MGTLLVFEQKIEVYITEGYLWIYSQFLPVGSICCWFWSFHEICWITSELHPAFLEFIHTKTPTLTDRLWNLTKYFFKGQKRKKIRFMVIFLKPSYEWTVGKNDLCSQCVNRVSFVDWLAALKGPLTYVTIKKSFLSSTQY